MSGSGKHQNANQKPAQNQRNYNVPELNGRWNPLRDGLSVRELSNAQQEELKDWMMEELEKYRDFYENEYYRSRKAIREKILAGEKKLDSKLIDLAQSPDFEKKISAELKNKKDDVNKKLRQETEISIDSQYNEFVVQQYKKMEERMYKNISDALIICRGQKFLKDKIDKLDKKIGSIEYVEEYPDYDSYIAGNLNNVEKIAQVIGENGQKVQENKNDAIKKANEFKNDKERYQYLINERNQAVEIQKDLDERTNKLLEIVKNDKYIKDYFEEFQQLIMPGDENHNSKDIVNMYNLRIKCGERYEAVRETALNEIKGESKTKLNEIKLKESDKYTSELRTNNKKLENENKTKINTLKRIYNKQVKITGKDGKTVTTSYAKEKKKFEDSKERFPIYKQRVLVEYQNKTTFFKKFAGLGKAVEDLKNSPKRFGYNSKYFNDMVEALENCSSVIDRMYDEDGGFISDDYRKEKCAEAIVACQDYIAKRGRDSKLFERSILGHYRLDCAEMLSNMLMQADPAMDAEIQKVREAKGPVEKISTVIL